MITFNHISLFLSIVITFFSFCWVFWLKEFKDKVFFLLIAFFIFIYSGLGGSLEEANSEYLNYFLIYIVILGIIIKFSEFGVSFTDKDDVLFRKYLSGRANKIMFIYFLVALLTLVFPEPIIYRLLAPPQPDVYAALEARFSEEDQGLIASMLKLLQLFMTPFFYWALFKYRNSILKVSFFLFLNLYISYCHDAYIGRYPILVALLVVLLFYFSKLSKKKKILAVFVLFASVPFFAFLFYQYTFLRHGDVSQDISMSMAMEILLGQEISYPLQFDSYKNYFDPSLIWNYFEWIFLLPLPGFMKFGVGSYPSYRFTEVTTGLYAGDRGFSVALPGLVGEAYFIFGPILFFIHAIILGVLIKAIYKSFKGAPSLTFVFVFYAVTLSFKLARGGTLSVYPSIFKDYLIMILFLLYLRKKFSKRVMVLNH